MKFFKGNRHSLPNFLFMFSTRNIHFQELDISITKTSSIFVTIQFGLHNSNSFFVERERYFWILESELVKKNFFH